jgi:hypothetical protein
VDYVDHDVIARVQGPDGVEEILLSVESQSATSVYGWGQCGEYREVAFPDVLRVAGTTEH